MVAGVFQLSSVAAGVTGRVEAGAVAVAHRVVL